MPFPNPQEIAFDKIVQSAATYPLDRLRGSAIELYAHLEQALCSLLATFSGMEIAPAAVIFYKLSARGRNQVLERLKKQKLEKAHSKFWNTALNRVQELDYTRNAIVHWHVVINVGDQSDFLNPRAYPTLRRPTFWINTDQEHLTCDDLEAFIAKATFVTNALNLFRMHLAYPNDIKTHNPALLDIFEQELVYPPPDSHPLSPKPAAPDTPPQSSAE